MTDLRKAAEMALDALEVLSKNELPKKGAAKVVLDESVIPALRQALAQPKREWIGLTEDEVTDCYLDSSEKGILIEEAIEAKLKEKNT